jgi:hypothetical protein
MKKKQGKKERNHNFKSKKPKRANDIKGRPGGGGGGDKKIVVVKLSKVRMDQSLVNG